LKHLILQVVGALLLYATPVYGQVQADAPKTDASLAQESVPAVKVEQIPDLILRFKQEDANFKEYRLAKVSEAFQEDPGNPAIRLETLWSSERLTLVELVGLNRRGNKASAVMAAEKLFLIDNNTGQKFNRLYHVGGTEITLKGDEKFVQLLPGEKLYVFFPPIKALNPHSLKYVNINGDVDSYIDLIDPLFRERYTEAHQRAAAANATVEDMRAFLMEFAKNDPDGLTKDVFIRLITQLKSQNTFDSRYQSYQLIKDPDDEQAALRLATTPEQKQRINDAIAQTRNAQAAKQEEFNRAKAAIMAERKRREEARQAEIRRVDESRKAQTAVADAQADQERCMRSVRCRREWEQQQARCMGEIQSCRGNCDRFTGSGSYSGWAALGAAVLARGCYAGCKCGSSFGGLLGKVNEINEGQAPSRTTKSSSTESSDTKTYQCKIYCKSASGPVVYQKFQAASRRDAAKMAGDRANNICATQGHSYSSAAEFKESQCSLQ
jgi:hypothetical protein